MLSWCRSVGSTPLGRERSDLLRVNQIGGLREGGTQMDGHFIFGLALILFTLGLCYYFRNENKKK
jgi:hypothetical protein